MSFTIIIPARNESENLKIILPKIKQLYPKAEVLIIDGNSKDDTKNICLKFNVKYIKEIPEGNKFGKAVAMRQGSRAAKNESIIFFDADCSHNPEDIIKLISPIINKDYVHVSGSRTLGGSSELFVEMSHIFRLIGSLIINKFISFVFKYHITDAQNGLRAFNRKFFIKINSKSIHTTIEQETVIKTLQLGYPILEIPTHEYNRVFGKSKINILIHGPTYVFQLLTSLAVSMCKKKPIKKPKNKYSNNWWE